MKITQMYTYPVKGMQGISLSQSTLQITGLPFDREWMVIDGKGQFVTQRQLPMMASIKTQLSNNTLTLSHHQAGAVKIPLHGMSTQKAQVKVWNHFTDAYLATDDVQDFIDTALGEFRRHKLRLVRFDRQSRRNVDEHYVQSGEVAHTYFSDGFPYLIVSESSLEHLNQTLVQKGEEAVAMSRFRPNLVVDDLNGPFAELSLHDLVAASEQYTLSIRKPCERCPVTLVDQQSGIRVGKTEPLATLRKLNPMSDKPGAFMGGNALLVNGLGQAISVGDTLIMSD
jgi:uncharacterized protein YcbX